MRLSAPRWSRPSPSGGRGDRLPRVARPDTYVPCNFANQLEVLPSFRRILSAAAETARSRLCSGSRVGAGRRSAQRSRHSDRVRPIRTVSVVSWKVAAGTTVKANDSLAEMEADKAVLRTISPVDGTVEEILVPEGTVPIHTPILNIRRSATRSNCCAAGQPFARRAGRADPEPAGPRGRCDHPGETSSSTIGLSLPFVVTGSNRLANDELSLAIPTRTAHDIFRRHRHRGASARGADGELLTLAAEAARRVLQDQRLQLSDLGASLSVARRRRWK